jgi:pyruvate-formate lyase-activating enzyme
VGRRTFGWCPVVELRMPAGCNAACRYCKGARIREDADSNTRESVLRAIDYFRLPETIALCAEWGDPCLHPEVIEAVNARIEKDWLVTRYNFLTNLSVIDPILRALPYTRTLLVHFTMSRPEHATTIMGYKSERMFERVLSHLRRICALRKEGGVSTSIWAQFIVEPSTLPFVAENYALLRDIEGLERCRFKSAHVFRRQLEQEPETIAQKRKLEELKGRVRYDWIA